jgi:acetolactate synthase small subunit
VSHALLLVRVQDRPGALERVLGLIRRRVLAVRRLSVSLGDGGLEVALRVDETKTPSDRLRAELASLTDVSSVTAEPERRTRELAVARLRAGGAVPPATPARPGETWRVLANGAEGIVVEITGSPEEVDAALARLRADGVLSSAMRSGEVALPGWPDTTPPPPAEQRRDGL